MINLHIIFDIKDIKLYVHVVTLSEKDNRKVSNEVYSNEDDNTKSQKSKDIIYQKVLSKTIT